MTVVVLGGGITGLACAHALGAAGVPTILLEASRRLGGKVATEDVDGFRIESGPDSFVAYRPAAVELCRELGLGETIIAPNEPRTVFVRAGGRFARLPDGMGLVLPTRMRPFITSDLFSPLAKLRMGLDVLLPRQLPATDMAVGEFLARRLGRALVDRLAGPLIGGVYGTPVDELSLDAVVPQLRDAEATHRSLLLASLADGRARARSGRKPASPFVSLAGGLGSLIDALTASIRSMAAVELRTGVAASRVEPLHDGVAIHLASGERILADALVVATPAPIAARLLEADIPAAAGALAQIPHGSTVVATIAYAADQVPADLTGHGFLVAAGEPLAITACTLSSRKWAGRAPDGSLLARAFIGGDLADSPASDEDLALAAHRDLQQLLGLRGSPAFWRLARHRQAMPHYTVGHVRRVAAAEAALAAHPQVVIAGGAYRGIGLPDCISQGRSAAARLQVLLGIPARVSIAGAPTTPALSTEALSTGALSTGALSTRPVTKLPLGTTATVRSVGAADATDLLHEGIRPGSRVRVSSVAPFGGPIVLGIGRSRVAVAREVAARIAADPS
jgi:oxygen-dependent protoporphyrinogen oxidase